MAVINNNLNNINSTSNEGLVDYTSLSADMGSLGINAPMNNYTAPKAITQVGSLTAPAHTTTSFASGTTTASSTVTGDDIQKEIQSLANSIGTQSARIAAGTGKDIAGAYLEEEKKKDESLILKVLNLLDAPRNAIAVGANYVMSGYDGGFFEGFVKGLTRKEEYYGSDFLEDMGVDDGVGRAVGGFIIDVFTDPLNYVDWATSSFVKGFIQGPTRSAAKKVAEETVGQGIMELGQELLSEGLEESANSIITNGGEAITKRAAEEAARNIVPDVTYNVMGDVASDTGRGTAKGILAAATSKVDDIERRFGLTFGNAKYEAVYYEGIRKSKETRRFLGGITDEAIELARNGEYGDEIMQMAQEYSNLKKTRAAVDMTMDKEAISTIDYNIAVLTDKLNRAMKPHFNDVRAKELTKLGVDVAAAEQQATAVYQTAVSGGLKSLELANNVDNVADLKKVLQIGDDKELYVKIIETAFQGRAFEGISDDFIKYSKVQDIAEAIRGNLLDNAVGGDIYKRLLRESGRDMRRGFGISIPFTNIGREITSANEMFELGAKTRAAIGYKLSPSGMALEPTVVGKALNTVGKSVEAVFGHLPILGAALDEANNQERATRWALKYIEQQGKAASQLAGKTAERSIYEYFKTLKGAGIDNKEAVEEVGNFVSSAIESKSLFKNATVDDWLNMIREYDMLDEDTIEKRALLELNEQMGGLSLDEAVAEMGELEEKQFKQWYEKTKLDITSRLRAQSTMKEELYKFTEEQQRAVLEVTKGIAEDFDNIGKQLVDLHLIPDDRMLEPEYWYFPHKMDLELLLENQMDPNRVLNSLSIRDNVGNIVTDADELLQDTRVTPSNNILGGITQHLTIRDASSFQRQYPATTVEVNKILKNKYGIDHMLETNAFNTYMMYALDQGKVIAEAKQLDDILNSFGIKVGMREQANMLRAKGYNLVVRRTDLEVMQVYPEVTEALRTYNDQAKKLNEELKVMKRSSKKMERLRDIARKYQPDIEEKVETIKASRKELNKTLRQQAKEVRATREELEEINSARAMLKKVIKGAGVDDIIDSDDFADMLEAKMNNPYRQGLNNNQADAITNITVAAGMGDSAFRTTDGMPLTFLAIDGNEDITRGFIQTADTTAGDLVYLRSAKPYDTLVDNVTAAYGSFHNMFNDEMKARWIAEGYDSIRLTDRLGNVAVIPFYDEDVIFKDNIRNLNYSDATEYIKATANTTDGGFINPKKVFDPSTSYSAIEFFGDSTQSRNTRVSLTNKIYREQTDNIDRYGKQITENDSIIKNLEKRYEQSENKYKHYFYLAQREPNGTLYDYYVANYSPAKQNMDNIEARIAQLKAEIAEAQKKKNSIENSKGYQWLQQVHRSKNAPDEPVKLTGSELQDLLKDDFYNILKVKGYDAILQSTDETGKAIYKALNKDIVYSKKDLREHYKLYTSIANMAAPIRTISDILTDTGRGRDALAKALIAYNMDFKDEANVFRRAINRVTKSPVGTGLKDVSELPYVKLQSNSQKKLIASLLSTTDDIFIPIRDDQIDDLFDIAQQLTIISKEDSNIVALPEEIIRTLNYGVKKQTDKGVSLVKDLMYKFNKIWKPSVTAWRPSFSVRNLTSGYFQAMMEFGGNVFDADTTQLSMKMVTSKNADEVIEFAGRKMSIKEWRDLAIKSGITNGFVSADINTVQELLAKNLKATTESTGTLSDIARHPLQTMEKASAGVEDYLRNLTFLSAIKKGYSEQFAADFVRNTQFDYADLSEIERKIKTVLPFYTWLRNNLPKQVFDMMDDPGLYQILLNRVPQASREASGMTDEEWENTPEWVRNLFPITMGKDKKTGRYRLFDTTLPYQDLATFSSPLDVVAETVTMLHPLLKTPLETWLNKNLYTGGALESYSGQTAEYAIQGTANPVLNAIAKVAPNALRNNPKSTLFANDMLNQFGSLRDMKYMSATQGTKRDASTVYGSKDVSLTANPFINYIENALFDTNQMKYYSPEAGLKDALYQQSRDLSNLIQKLTEQGYVIPSASDIRSAAKKTASTSSKGQAMVNNTVSSATLGGTSMQTMVKNALLAGGYSGIIGSTPTTVNKKTSSGQDKIVTFGTGTYVDKQGNTQTVDVYKGSWGKDIMKADDGTVYREFITTDGNTYFLNQEDSNLVAWHESPTFEAELEKYKTAYNEWKSSPNKSTPTWWSLYNYDSNYTPDIYNIMVTTNFNPDKLSKWFVANPSKIQWKQQSANY